LCDDQNLLKFAKSCYTAWLSVVLCAGYQLHWEWHWR